MADKIKIQMNEFLKHDFDEVLSAIPSPPDLNELAEDWGLMKARLQNVRDRTLMSNNMIFESSIAEVE